MTPVIDKLGWLYIKDRRVLGARSRGKTMFYTPGGKRDPGESDVEALSREIKEELSVDLVPASIEHAGTFTAQADGKPPGTMVRLTCFRAEFAGDITAAAEIEEVRWLGYQDRAQCSPAMQIILDWLKEQGLIE